MLNSQILSKETHIKYLSQLLLEENLYLTVYLYNISTYFATHK